jgi:hypothetical protein
LDVFDLDDRVEPEEAVVADAEEVGFVLEVGREHQQG